MDERAAEPVIGREAELARLARAVRAPAPGVRDAAGPAPGTTGAPQPADPVLMLVGDVGAGKSVLLERAAREAGAGGARVLRAEGSESESALAFAALHQLLRPVRAAAGVLPERQRAALDTAFGAGAAGPARAADGCDPMLVGVAVLSLLSAVGEERPVVVVLDDAQWCDRASLDALAFAARRLAGEPVTMLLGARTGDAVHGFGRHVPTLELDPLDDAAAARLLDLQPRSPTGLTRTRVIEQAAGNPLALVELSRAATAPHAPVPPHSTGPLPPSFGPLPPSFGPLPLDERLERLFAGRLDDLPAGTARAVLLLAAVDSADTAVAASAGLPDASDGAWRPAERAGLVRRVGRHVRFRHPLARSAVYHAAPADARREAHRALAAMLRGAPDRRAWHLAAACLGPDAAVSAELERSAGRARARGGHAAAARALQRAAELAPDPAESARLLVDAAGAAVLTGDIAWVDELAAAVRARTGDPSHLAGAAVHAGRLAALTVRHSAVFARLARTAADLAATRPGSSLDLLAGAAVVSFYSGDGDQRRRTRDLLRRLPAGAAHDVRRAWVRTVTDPLDGRDELLGALRRSEGADTETGTGADAGCVDRPARLVTFGIMAWLLDETPRAVRAFDEAFDRWEVRGSLPEGLGGAAAWAYVERGRWAQAREACARTAAVGRARGLDHAVACAAAVDSTVLAFQGDTAAARARGGEALALIDPLESRSVFVYAQRALGAADAADGAYDRVYERLRAVFTADGAPVHHHASYPAVADLAAAAVRCGRREEAAVIVERCAAALAAGASPRLRALLARARGLLADRDDPEPHFWAALADPALEQWPFERAQALLDFAEWLRRRRRIAQARGPLTRALETFRSLGARPWAERARAEARAAGLDVAGARPDALAALSPQQRQIISLAARGLTNREIGEKLFLSPRTVGSHLYRSFPRLGITARSQLRDLVAGASTPAGGDDRADAGTRAP